MGLSDIENHLSLISADAGSVQLLALEVSEDVELNSSEYFKLHAIYEIAETQIRSIERAEDEIIRLKAQL